MQPSLPFPNGFYPGFFGGGGADGGGLTAFGGFGDTASAKNVSSASAPETTLGGFGDTPNSVPSGGDVGFFAMTATSSAAAGPMAAA